MSENPGVYILAGIFIFIAALLLLRDVVTWFLKLSAIDKSTRVANEQLVEINKNLERIYQGISKEVR